MEGRSTGEKEWGHKEYLERERSSRITAEYDRRKAIGATIHKKEKDELKRYETKKEQSERVAETDLQQEYKKFKTWILSDTEKKSEHLLKDPAEAEKSEGASKGPAEGDASKPLKDALHLFRVRSDAFAKHLLVAQQMVIKNRVELYEMDPAPPQSYSGKPTGEEWVDQEAMLCIDVDRWGASTVKTEANKRRQLEDDFFAEFVPRVKQVTHKIILQQYPILAAYVFRSMGRENLQRRAGDALYTNSSEAQQQYCEKIMEIVLRQMKAAWDWARDTKSTPNTSNQASGSVKRKHEDEAASRKRLRDNMQGSTA